MPTGTKRSPLSAAKGPGRRTRQDWKRSGTDCYSAATPTHKSQSGVWSRRPSPSQAGAVTRRLLGGVRAGPPTCW
ncbi:unnamed protein product [Rangifer tarandus platyrhynchus]|uniref:Uncharacterized protein n=1 Tax=Rangifer tarandus platyrhynchus TaxID=3082113 RepID=A0AC60A994_RANTA